ncbi:MAG: endo alpha-1,4 polygalactosaminidase [Spirochaetales bacterium]|nr:endo alpha-1,4 polygalactosaminidase [Spirochaetales bacterium]
MYNKPIIYLLFILLITSSLACEKLDYRDEMRGFVKDLSRYAKKLKPGFIVITQNGNELLDTEDTSYLNAIDGVAQEDLFYGYDDDNVPTRESDSEYLLRYLELAKKAEIGILAIDYCSKRKYMDDSYARNAGEGFISFAADSRMLDKVPGYPFKPFHVNDGNVGSLPDAENFLYMINPGKFDEKHLFIEALTSKNYDLIITDLFFNEDPLSKKDIAVLKKKARGKKRLVISYMSIGEAESYRYYWKNGWKQHPPSWLDEENPYWKGNFKVKYWIGEWQAVIYGNEDSYIKKIIDAGFDGVYLDIIDAFDYYEGKQD